MKVALTGATGFIGSHVLAELQDHGHEVTALVHDEAGAETVAAKGATPVVVDLYDRSAVVSALGDAGRRSPRGHSRRRDQRGPGLGGGRRGDRGIRWTPASPTSTSLACGCTGPIRRSPKTHRSTRRRWSPWKVPIAPAGSRCQRDARDRSSPRVLAVGGGGGGVPGLLLGSPPGRHRAENLIVLGTGATALAPRSTSADLADFFRRALEDDFGPRRLHRARHRPRPRPSPN